jgi:hypothetical protein
MNAQELRNLSEAYMEVYDELDEAAKRSPKKVRGSKDTKSYQDGRSQAGMMVSGDSQVSGAGYMRRGGGIQTQTDPNERQPKQGRMDRYTRDEMEYRKARLKKEETDLYNIILSHLLDEGYAETQEQAEVIMVNMSEDWREDIVEKTAMAKRGYDETEIRTKIANSTGGGEAADRAGELADRKTFGQRGVDPKARQNLARAQRGDFRKTTSSSPGLKGYAYKATTDSDKAKQAARGAQRGALTPKEKKQFGR